MITSFLENARKAWAEGDKACCDFGSQLLSAVGYDVGVEQSEPRVGNKARHRAYRAFLSDRARMPANVLELHATVDSLGAYLAERYFVVSSNVATLTPHAGTPFPRLEESPHALSLGIEPWSVLGWGNDRGFLEASSIADYLHDIVMGSLDQSQNASWMVHRLSHMARHQEACLEWFSSLEARLPTGSLSRSYPDAVQTDVQRDIWDALEERAMSQELLIKLTRTPRATLNRHLKPLRKLGLISRSRKNGYSRNDLNVRAQN